MTGYGVFNGPSIARLPDSLVVHHIPPFPLHLWLGLGNLLAKKVMDKISTSSRDAWLKPLGLVMSAMHGGQFNGNMLTGVLGSTEWSVTTMKVR